MPQSRTDDGARRPRTFLSCLSCRAKKLKCDRQNPCSNCTTRRLSCRYGSQLSVSAGPRTISSHGGNEESSAGSRDVHARLRALELAVFGSGSSVTLSTHENAVSSTAISTPESEIAGERALMDSRWLEGVGSRLMSVLPDFSDALNVTVHDLEHFTWDAEHLFVSRQIDVPPREVGLAYEEWYKRHIDALIPILHMPSVQSMTEAVYDKLHRGGSGDVGSVALMLAIYASADLWGVRRAAKSRTSDRQTEMSAILAKHALCAAEHARISSRVTIENLQATILLMFYLSHLEGWTSRARMLHSNSVTMARDLGLHKIDAVSSRTATTTQAQIIEAEIGRRIWWHITCTDWLLACAGGPHEGVYAIHLQHMAVEKPRNLNPEDLSLQSSTFSRPEDEPTTMTYHLQRMKVALVCREVIDTLGPSYLTGEFAPAIYEKVRMLDAKFCDILTELPEFLQVDDVKRCSATRSQKIDHDQFALPTAVLNFLIRTRRCKLHLPFLIRARSDPRYMHSRYMCLESARMVIRIQQMYSEEAKGPLEQSPCLGSLLQHMFYAAIVLVVDTCVNNPHDTKQIAEVRHAIYLIEQVKGESRYADKFLDSLMAMLRKHQIPVEQATHPKGDVSGPQVTPANYGANLTRLCAPEARPDLNDTAMREQNVNSDTTFDDAWQDFLGTGSPLLDLQTWDSLMNDLEMHIV